MSTPPALKYCPLHGTPGPTFTEAHRYRQALSTVAWSFNPWTGERRDGRDMRRDPLGYLIEPTFRARVEGGSE